MLKELQTLKNEIEEQIGEKLTDKEIAYFDQIETVKDLKGYKNFEGPDFDENLVYDAAIAMGLSDNEAEAIIESVEVPDIDALEKEYQRLNSEINVLGGIEYEIEYEIVEEISAEGFASQTLRGDLEKTQRELNQARANLIDFKAKNATFLAWRKDKTRKEKARKDEEMFEKFWTN